MRRHGSLSLKLHIDISSFSWLDILIAYIRRRTESSQISVSALEEASTVTHGFALVLVSIGDLRRNLLLNEALRRSIQIDMSHHREYL